VAERLAASQEGLNSKKLVTIDLVLAGILASQAEALHTHRAIFRSLPTVNGSRDSLVGIATGYVLDDQAEREFESR
jgi:hypothetical protein